MVSFPRLGLRTRYVRSQFSHAHLTVLFCISARKSPPLMLSVPACISLTWKEKSVQLGLRLSQTWFQMTGEMLNTFSHITNKNVWLWGFNALKKGALYLDLSPRSCFSGPAVRQKWDLCPPKSDTLLAKSVCSPYPKLTSEPREAPMWKKTKQNLTFSQRVYQLNTCRTLDVHLDGRNGDSELFAAGRYCAGPQCSVWPSSHTVDPGLLM